jgi:hypothetical protein
MWFLHTRPRFVIDVFANMFERFRSLHSPKTAGALRKQISGSFLLIISLLISSVFSQVRLNLNINYMYDFRIKKPDYKIKTIVESHCREGVIKQDYLTEERHFSPKGNILSDIICENKNDCKKTIYTYDDSCRLKKWEQFDEHNKLDKTYEYSYDNAGHLIKCNEYDDGTKISEVTDYKHYIKIGDAAIADTILIYDDDGKLKKTITNKIKLND